MRHTIVALFDTYGQAEAARETLVRAGFARSDIELQAQPEPTADTAVGHPPGLLASIERFLSSLFTSNHDATDMQRYTDAVRRGAVLVCVRAASESHAELARNALTQLGALDISEREPGWDAAAADPEARRAHSILDELGVGNPVPTARDAPHGEEVPVARDTIPVGDVPVARDTLRTEDVPLTRDARLADDVPPSSLAAAPGFAPNDDLGTQAAIAAAGAPGAGAVMGAEGPPAERMYSGSATANTAGADSRPAEAAGAGAAAYASTGGATAASYGGPAPVGTPMRESWSSAAGGAAPNGLGSTGSSAATPGSTVAGSTVPDEFLEYEEDFRTHYDDLYAQMDTQYEDYRPAYHYGVNVARDDRYRDRPWEDVEPEVRREWEASPSGTGNTWERFKAAVRHGWDRVTGHHHV
jgi:hypothetical protein